jgi:hypothetical protein
MEVGAAPDQGRSEVGAGDARREHHRRFARQAFRVSFRCEPAWSPANESPLSRNRRFQVRDYRRA